MGNLCGKPSSDSFSSPGRTLGSAPPTNPTSASLPPKITSSPGRTLGSSKQARSSDATGDVREAAAKAAQERAARASQQQQKGKLGKDLARQKGETQSQTLAGASADERRRREIELATEARHGN